MIGHIHQALSTGSFIPHGHCYLWIPSLLWLHVISDTLIGIAYVGIATLLYLFVRTVRLPFSPVFIAFGLFIALCGLTHFMQVWTVWNPHYWVSGYLKAATALASVATAVGLLYVRPQVLEVVYAARLSEQRRNALEASNAELAVLYERVKELDEHKTEFFANVSHELRTPLALILGNADQLLQQNVLTDEQRQQIEGIHQNAQALVKQVNDLLDVARLEAGETQVHYAAVDVAGQFRSIAARFEAAAKRRHLQFEIQAPTELTAEVDAQMVERICVNLLSNAFKFTPDGGTVTASLQQRDQVAEITVSDSGPGVPVDQRQVIFERFRQAETGPARSHGGTGLGLAIVKDLVALHGGRVDVGEGAAGGACFTVALPLDAPLGTVVERAPQGLPGLADTTESALAGSLVELDQAASRDGGAALRTLPGRPLVLVVEDNPALRDFVSGLVNTDCNVATAGDGQEGLEQAEALRPDLIITDIMMPRLSGDRLVAALRSRRDFDAVPILLLSAKADDRLRVKLLREGAQDYVTKPFQPAELQSRVANLVSMKRARDTLQQELAMVSTDLEELAREIALRNRQLQTALNAAEVASETAERASEVKSYFLGLVSHELRTPLTTLQMNLQMMLRGRGPQLPEPLRPQIERLARASQQMHTLIEGLLEYTRLESGRIHIDRQPVDLVSLAAETLEEHAPTVVAGRVALALEPPQTPLPPLMTDPRLVKVILSNLISNAVKFTTEGSITVVLGRSDHDVTLEVADTGPGIAEDDLERIFQPFEQLEPVQRKTTPGIGLGLALARRICDALGGSVGVHSRPGRGSTFTVRLPLE